MRFTFRRRMRVSFKIIIDKMPRTNAVRNTSSLRTVVVRAVHDISIRTTYHVQHDINQREPATESHLCPHDTIHVTDI